MLRNLGCILKVHMNKHTLVNKVMDIVHDSSSSSSSAYY